MAAHISSEQIKEMREEIKRIAPEWKFSLTNQDNIEVKLILRSAPFELLNEEFKNRNLISLKGNEFDGLPGIETLREIEGILNKGNHDNSDLSTDYFDVGWYVSVSVGEYERPFVVK